MLVLGYIQKQQQKNPRGIQSMESIIDINQSIDIDNR